jgi:hypothetical protein
MMKKAKRFSYMPVDSNLNSGGKPALSVNGRAAPMKRHSPSAAASTGSAQLQPGQKRPYDAYFTGRDCLPPLQRGR